MESTKAVAALAALAHDRRLAVFRLLVREGPSGLPAGDVAKRLRVPPSSLSHHLGLLERAGLLQSRRIERNVFYAVDLEGTRRLLGFLTEDCCRGRPDLCGYGANGGCRDDHDLPQSEVRDVAERPGDDPRARPGAARRRVPEDAAEPG